MALVTIKTGDDQVSSEIPDHELETHLDHLISEMEDGIITIERCIILN